MKMVMLLMSLLACLFCLSCGPAANEQGGPGSGPVLQLKPSDLEPSLKLKEESADSVLNFLLEESSFSAPHGADQTKSVSRGNPKEDSQKSSEEKTPCEENVLKGITLTAKDDGLQIQGDVDICPCYEQIMEMFKGPQYKMSLEQCEAKVRMFAAFRCDGADFSKLNGKTLEDISNDVTLQQEVEKKFCAEKGTRDEFATLYVYNKMKTKISSKEKTSIQEVETENISAYMTADSKPCRKTIDSKFEISEGECLKVERTLTRVEKTNGKSSENEGYEDYSKLQLQHLKADKTSSWYQSGVIKFKKNNWTGDIIYSITEDPIYEFTDGKTKKAGKLSEEVASKEVNNPPIYTPKPKEIMKNISDRVKFTQSVVR